MYLNQFPSAMTTLMSAVNSRKTPDDQKYIGMYYLAQIHKRNQDYSKAVSFWKKSAKSRSLISPYIELAMYYEHKENDYSEAIHWTLSAIELISTQPDSAKSKNTIASLDHRLSRLKRKMSL